MRRNCALALWTSTWTDVTAARRLLDRLRGRLYHPRMDAEFNRLESQLEQLVGLFEAGRTETRALRARVAVLEAENRNLAAKVSLATEKLESLLQALPED